MTDAPDPYQTLFDSLCAERGGLARLSAVDLEIVSMICKTLIGARAADAGDISKVAATVSGLLQSLPPPVATASTALDLTLLTDSDLAELERIYAIGSGQQPPAPEPVAVERERGPGEVWAEALGRYVDAHSVEWSRRAPTDLEQIELRNMFQYVVSGANVIARNLWRDIFMGDMQDTIERAVKAALAFAGKTDTRLLPNEPDAPKPPANIHADPSALTAVSDYSFLNGGGRGHFGDNNG
jgi:hypothetical protein